jgi:hypothetical protein
MFDMVKFLREESEYPVLYAKLPARTDRAQRWFFADKRAVHDGKGNMLEPLWVCVHGASLSPATILRNVRGFGAHIETQPWVGLYVIEADTMTQASAWLRARGENTKNYLNPWHEYNINAEQETFIMVSMKQFDPCCNGCGAYPCQRETAVCNRPTALPTGVGLDTLANLQSSLLMQAAQVQARIDRIASFPDEPVMPDDRPNIVYFQKRFSVGGKKYDYAAIQAGDGKWYTTGPKTPKGFAWADLIQWINEDVDTVVYSVRKLKEL